MQRFRFSLLMFQFIDLIKQVYCQEWTKRTLDILYNSSVAFCNFGIAGDDFQQNYRNQVQTEDNICVQPQGR